MEKLNKEIKKEYTLKIIRSINWGEIQPIDRIISESDMQLKKVTTEVLNRSDNTYGFCYMIKYYVIVDKKIFYSRDVTHTPKNWIDPMSIHEESRGYPQLEGTYMSLLIGGKVITVEDGSGGSWKHHFGDNDIIIFTSDKKEKNFKTEYNHLLNIIRI